MKKATSAILAFLLLSGCGNSGEDVHSTSNQSPTTKAIEAELGGQSAVPAPAPEKESGDSPIDAAELLASTLASAKARDKRVFVHLGAPWCGWCKKLEEFLDTNAALFADDYIVVKIDVEEMEHGGEVAAQLRGARTGGIPWITILDAEGTELVTSDGPDGNIGCPVSENECAYFVTMIEMTIRHAPEGRVADIAKALEVFAEKRRQGT